MSHPLSGLGAVTPWSEVLLPATSDAQSGESFGGVLKNAMQQVNDLTSSASTEVEKLLQGGSTDMNTVMVAVEKADVAFQLAMQVRNKVVSAYQDIEKMQF